jgi:hypothetical protein
MSVAIPRRIAEELKRRGIDAGPLIVDFSVNLLKLDPQAAAESHIELAMRYLEEGRKLIDGGLSSPVKSSIRLRRKLSKPLQHTST